MMQTLLLSLVIASGIFPLNPVPTVETQNTEQVADQPSPSSSLLVGVGLGVAAIAAIAASREGEQPIKQLPADQEPLTVVSKIGYDKPVAAIEPARRIDTWEDDSPAPHSQIVEPTEPKLNAVYDAGMVTLTGGKGGGKTTAGAAICRHRVKRGHTLKIFNHHYEFGAYKPFKVHQLGCPNQALENTVYGVGQTLEGQFQSICEGLEEVLDECDRRYGIRQMKPRTEWDFLNQPITVGIEELGEYKTNVPAKLMQRFLKCVCIKFRKANMYFIGISQNDTMEMFGGVSGLAEMLQDGVVNLRFENQPDANVAGGLSPTGYGQLSINDSKPVRVKTNEFKEAIPAGQNDLDFTDLFSSKPESAPELPEHLEAILKYANFKKWWFSASELKHANRLFKNADTDPELIRGYFRELADLGLGELEGEGERLKFKEKLQTADTP
jgi:hypothetical protein